VPISVRHATTADRVLPSTSSTGTVITAIAPLKTNIEVRLPILSDSIPNNGWAHMNTPRLIVVMVVAVCLLKVLVVIRYLVM